MSTLSIDDGFTRTGAKRLAERIRAYWCDRGYDVAVRVEQRKGFSESMRRARWFVVRSDLVNGRPRR